MNTSSAADSRPEGYGFGSAGTARSPFSPDDLLRLEQTVGWSSADAVVLHRHADLIRAHAAEMVDSWRARIAAQPHLAQWFFGPDGQPEEAYKARVKARFVRWVVDVATRPHDQEWLDYQEEIGLRHTPARKNITDGAHTPPLVPLRYLLAFAPVVADARGVFAAEIADEAELDTLVEAWRRSVHLHVVLWSRPYTRDGLW